jgi:hypothetical protein
VVLSPHSPIFFFFFFPDDTEPFFFFLHLRKTPISLLPSHFRKSLFTPQRQSPSPLLALLASPAHTRQPLCPLLSNRPSAPSLPLLVGSHRFQAASPRQRRGPGPRLRGLVLAAADHPCCCPEPSRAQSRPTSLFWLTQARSVISFLLLTGRVAPFVADG